MGNGTTAPKGLGTAGRALWRKIASSLPDGWELEEREEAILRLAARQADDLSRLESAISKDGAMALGSAGQPVVNPAIIEARQSRLAIGRLLGQLALPDDDAAGGSSASASETGRKAANARWSRERRKEEMIARKRGATENG